jgi:diguanylate cyclase (GGDEF)-like protein/putative nucleotidyltransferase with HDIG domain
LLTLDSSISLALLLAAAFTALFFVFLYGLKRQDYLVLWTAGWALVALQAVPSAVEPWFGRALWEAPLHHWLMGAAGLMFLLAAQLYTQARLWKQEVVGAAVILGVWVVAYQLKWLNVAPGFGVALIFTMVAWVFWQEGRKQQSQPDLMLSGAFVLWTGMLLYAVFRESELGQVSWGARMMVIIPELFVAALMVMAVYEEEKRRVERNMLALSNLNLATSGFVGGEIQKMLAQALDRVLNVARIPSGALFLQHGDPQGPKSVVASGMSDRFCAAAQEERLDDHLVNLVARLGGLVVFKELARTSSWAALEREPAFRRFRELAVAEDIRTVAGISLHAKDKVFGLLLLGTPDNRSFTPAELRLLLALGHQIGMAVENSYLIQQTARRTEELHILNEIGRVFSSTLNVDELFDNIFTEMRRLFDVSNFFIALYDARKDEVRYEVEIVDGKRIPRRSRPAGNYLPEYLMRTRQPLLVRERMEEEKRRLGLDSLHTMNCFCGVPLILYNRAIGVMAVHSPQERAFDEGHLELLRVLASEAGIAMENARLFSEEEKKSRHLTLLNNISRHGITTLNSDEMLAKMVGEMEIALTYDHLGIGLLDYASKEVVIHAEGGKRRGAQGRRIPLDEGLVGQVARSGHMATVREAGSGLRPVIEDSSSAIALPIVYADQLLGVLYVETQQAWDFAEEEVLLLQTLADLVAGALHNALTFQRAQEQAITDGLTGVKTHRFFMEALSAEWKRSTRAGRPFALVLMDLDRFKFVNDFYGHLEGDVVLQRVGHILEQNCRRSDVVARYGGDEFVILMPETNIEQGRQLAGKLRAWISSDPLLREKNISASFGIATFPVHGSTPQELVQVADASMYLSKHQGGNAVSTADHYDPDEARKWKRDVLEAYLGVTLKRQFSTGPEAFEEIHRRLEHFTQSIGTHSLATESSPGEGPGGESGTPLPATVIETLTSLALAVDAKDAYTQGHSQKVSAYALMLAQALNLGEEEIEDVRLAALLHDVGKVGIPEVILNKNGPLDAAEWETMKSHATLGAQLLDPLCNLPTVNGEGGAMLSTRRLAGRLREMVLHHHEFFDGSGYPAGIAGTDIPRGARVIALADAYDTITSDRMYKKGRTPVEAFAELERCGASQFDPEMLRLFLEVLRRAPQPQPTTHER